MPDQKNTNSEATPHFDGKNEAIINDPTGANQMGITVETEQEFTHNTPFPADLKENKDIQKLNQIINPNQSEKKK